MNVSEYSFVSLEKSGWWWERLNLVREVLLLSSYEAIKEVAYFGRG